MNLDAVTQVQLAELTQASIRVAIVLIVWWVLSRVVRVLLGRVESRLLRDVAADQPLSMEDRKRVDTLMRLLRQIVTVFLFVTLALVMLMQLGIAVGPILASAGVVGIAVGFGAQSLVRDIITGFFFVMENQVRVGDVAVINGTGGLVEAMTLRTLVIRDQAGTVHVFPNGSVDTLSNMTRGWSAYVFDIGVAYKEDPSAAIAVIRATAEGMQSDPSFADKIIEKPEIFGVDKLDESAVVIKGRIKTLPIKQWEVGREFLKRVKLALDEAGIEIPFPHRTLVFASSGATDAREETLLRAVPPAAAKTAPQAKEDTGGD
ncbi:small conductance mechanosensitive channel [Panacagrimonas perspica]|uniref:Small conductance mechanosensitive channel n=1 Tax=Panacagrimonas perspica TaxID=381431 RepID=A0A4S3K7R3_9GAMM|nr:mechanosensitive ion channel family protein [Panacagrimonas perspica]TDU25588.1 small conductance mechanosensitive channel [Panacagrimonas perspica]THD03814.1 mechanosensitive ion channel protein MscS [Panacagrimonas perspica]